uniref:Protein wntless homolog n=1 Tax=Panagrellus redivivus TaxID=6233 RepID=A0A7E4UTP9_PANRE
MAHQGAVIENLSNRKLFVILLALLGAQIVFFLVGALCSPQPSTSMEFLTTKCIDKHAGNSKEWFHLRPPKCNPIDNLEEYRPRSADMRDIVFVAQMPHPRSGHELEYSPWFQFLLGMLDVEIEYNPNIPVVPKALLELEISLAYRTKDDGPTDWHEFVSSTVQRSLECSIDPSKMHSGYLYNCSTIDLFELGANPYPFYLLNIRLPVNRTACAIDPSGPNCGIGLISDLRVIAIHQNGGFTAIWLWMKTIVSPLAILATLWYYKRVSALNRPKYLIEKAILALGVALCVMDFPLEWVTLWFRTPLMLLISDLRQGLFYTVLFSFWLVFAGEHLIDDSARNNIKNYWKNLSFILTASACLLIYDLAERGMQLSDPFFSIWSSDRGAWWAYASLYIAFACTVAYFAFLFFKVIRVWQTIKTKRSAHLHQLNEIRRLKIEAIIYRFKFLMIFTLVCAFSTIISYVMKQWGEGQLHSDEPEESFLTQSTSSFFTGTFGMWNIYVILLLSMYAPSHKHYASAQILMDENEDLMDDIGTESAPMTTFLKANTD